jgi:hypothetical protein
VDAVTYIFLLLEAVSHIVSLALAAPAHVEHAQAVVFWHVLRDGEGFEPVAAQSVQIDDAFLGEQVFLVLVSRFETANEGALEFFVARVVHFGEIFDDELVLVEVIG